MVDKRGARAPSLPVIPVLVVLVLIVLLGASLRAAAAPYAAMVMDARTGEVLHSRNAETRLHPASLTKMMTLYIAFEAVENGEIGLDDKVKISKKAAAEVPSKLGLRAGSRIELRFLIRAAAIKSANDAATAIGEAISGSEAAFARRMNRTAKALGMTRTTFKNAHGLTEQGHMSTARDMTVLGRRLFYDYPEYYNLFSRRSTSAKLATVYNTNRRFLNAYSGADGIKTGYTRAAGFNLVASAERGSERIITTVFGGNSTASRNAEVARLMDIGFKRAPRYAKVRKPAPPNYAALPKELQPDPVDPLRSGKIVRVVRAVPQSIRPKARAVPQTAPDLLLALETGLESAAGDPGAATALDEAVAQAAAPQVEESAGTDADAAGAMAATTAPAPRPDAVVAASAVAAPSQAAAPAAASATANTANELASAAMSAAEAVAPRAVSFLRSSPTPAPRPEEASAVAQGRDRPVTAAQIVAAADASAAAKQEIVARVSTSGGRHWSISLGRYSTRFAAEKILLKTALAEMSTLDGALRKVTRDDRGFNARFVGLDETQAARACLRLEARGTECLASGPS
ncbi:MAG: D-alanyl-D-alanine carboxypeptidase family protein [Pseudomonadota bacterium]